MPKTAINYDNTVFYEIVCKNVNIKERYVGHTTNFIKRKANHKSDCTNVNSKKYNLYVYQFIRENGDWKNWDMIEIERRACRDHLEACKFEREHIERLGARLNATRPHVSREEHLALMREYYQTNLEEITHKKCEKIQCGCGGRTTQCHIARHNKSKKHQQWLVSQQEPEGEPDET